MEKIDLTYYYHKKEELNSLLIKETKPYKIREIESAIKELDKLINYYGGNTIKVVKR